MKKEYYSDVDLLLYLDKLPPIGSPQAPATTLNNNKDAGEGGFKRAVSNILFWTLIFVLLAGSILFATSNNPEKSIFGYRFYNIETGSMTPGAYSNENGFTDGFYAGDMIIIRRCDTSEIKKNDVITFMPGDDPNVFLTHRVVEIENELSGQPALFFVTRGDANNTNDPPISAQMVIGKKVMTIPRMGRVIQYIREHLVLSLTLMVSSFILVLALRMYFKKSNEPS